MMQMEAERMYEFRNGMGDLDPDWLLKPYAYLKLLNQLVEEHFEALGMSQEKVMAHHLAWVLISAVFEIARPVRGTERVFGNTWYSGRDGISFRREFVFRDEAGELLFQGSCFSVLMDPLERSIFRELVLPFDFLEPVEVLTVEAVPSRRIRSDFQQFEERGVRSSHLDCLGHVNNIRYLEYVYDTLDEAERGRLGQLRRLEVYFQGELNPGERVSVQKGEAGGELLVRGVRMSDGRVSFDCSMTGLLSPDCK